MNKNITIVTGLWDLGRGNIEGWGKRDFQQYKDRFFDLLKTEINMAIWIPKELEQEVWSIRKQENTRVYIKEVTDFKTWFPFFNEVQEIRTNPNWSNFAGWLPESPQASLEYYNPMMMSKVFMLHDTTIFNPFSSEYFFWMDGGLTSTVNSGYFHNDKVLDNLDYYCELNDKYIHITYPYETNDEIHGFERKKMAEFCGVDYVTKIARGGFFGGKKDLVKRINELYYDMTQMTLKSGFMGADECLFTILCYRHPDLIHTFEIEQNGLVWPFFEYLKTVKTLNLTKKRRKKTFSELKTIIYVLTYNSPKQFETLIKSYEEIDEDFLNKSRKILINNSTDRNTDNEYKELCEKYDFEEIKKDNIGICGGRQFIAEHFNDTDYDYYMFLEDDMFLHKKSNEICSSGFLRYKEKLYLKSLYIIHENNYDFLKLSFTEFFGDNMTQWSWYNVPEDVRIKYFPNNPKLPVIGLDPNAPKTNFTNMKKYKDIAYLEGEIYYCNWPSWFSREGNQKVFIDVKWSHPFEQTWMSHVFQLQQKKKINSAVLLLSPINHDRFEFYPADARREN